MLWADPLVHALLACGIALVLAVMVLMMDEHL